VFIANGAIGLALGVLIRHSAAALGIGLIYVLAVEVLGVRFIDSLNNGAYKWVGNLFVGQNATALLRALPRQRSAPARFRRSLRTRRSSSWGVYFVGLIVLAAGLLRMKGCQLGSIPPRQPITLPLAAGQTRRMFLGNNRSSIWES